MEQSGPGRRICYGGRQLEPGFVTADVAVAIEAILVELAGAGITRDTVLSFGRWQGLTGEDGTGAVAVLFPMP